MNHPHETVQNDNRLNKNKVNREGFSVQSLIEPSRLECRTSLEQSGQGLVCIESERRNPVLSSSRDALVGGLGRNKPVFLGGENLRALFKMSDAKFEIPDGVIPSYSEAINYEQDARRWRADGSSRTLDFSFSGCIGGYATASAEPRIHNYMVTTLSEGQLNETPFGTLWARL